MSHSCRFARRFLFACVPLLSCAGPALAQDSQFDWQDFRQTWRDGRLTHVLDIDNDSLLLNRDDGFYTSGVRYAAQASVQRGAQTDTAGWRFGQELYTSSDIKLAPREIAPGDHPYAGWLYGGLYRQREQADGSSLLTGLDLGCFGACAGGQWSQKTLHHLIQQPQPQGWSTQFKSEVGAMLYAKWVPLRWAPAAGIDLAPNLQARFGNIHTDAGAGLLLRAGRLDAAAPWFAFLRVDVKRVGYDATLQGGYFSAHQGQAVPIKRNTGEAELGLSWRGANYGLSAAVVRRSNEMANLPNGAGAQNYAHLQLSYTP